MGGYIGARSGTISATVANVQDVTATDSTPEVTIVNNTHEDTDGGREGKVIFKGQQSGGEESTLAEIQASHDGTSDDEKADLIFRTNDGSDGASPTERVRIDSNGSILTATLGTDNVHLGEGAGASIASGGNNNVVIGKNAGTSLTTGDNNTAIGHQALDASDTAGDNTAIGSGALSSITTGGYNTAVGRNSFANATTENRNVGLGIETGFDTVTGTQNTFIGSYAGMDNTANYSTSVGDAAGSSATSGGYNTFIGQQAGNSVTTGHRNTIIGRYNGNQGGLDIRTSNNYIVLSDGDGNPRLVLAGDGDCFIGGSYGTNIRGSNAQLQLYSAGEGEALVTATNDTSQGGHIHRSLEGGTSTHYIHYYENSVGTNVGKVTHNNSTTSYTTTSDYRLKENVINLTGAITRLKQLEPKRFNFIADADTTVDGFLAHEVQSTVPEAITGTHNEVDDDDNPVYQGIDQAKLVPLLTAALQEAIAKIETLETKVAALEAE